MISTELIAGGEFYCPFYTFFLSKKNSHSLCVSYHQLSALSQKKLPKIALPPHSGLSVNYRYDMLWYVLSVGVSD
jgi:hypothetical protein